MDEEALNTSIRRFLRTVGVGSQQKIEEAVRRALEDGRLDGTEAIPASVTLRIGDLDLEANFDGTIELVNR